MQLCDPESKKAKTYVEKERVESTAFDGKEGKTLSGWVFI
jgi:hypothetical protein